MWTGTGTKESHSGSVPGLLSSRILFTRGNYWEDNVVGCKQHSYKKHQKPKTEESYKTYQQKEN